MKRMALLLGGLALFGAGCLSGEGNVSPLDPGSAEPTVTVLEIEPVPVEEVVVGVKKVEMEATDFAFAPPTITVSTGQEVEVTFTKNGGIHTFVIDEIDLKERVAMDETIRFTAPKTPGQYSYYCDVGNHRALGMQGVLIVR